MIHQIEQTTPLKNLTQESLFLDLLKPSIKNRLVNQVIHKWKKNLLSKMLSDHDDFLELWVKEVCEEYQVKMDSWIIKRMMEDERPVVKRYRERYREGYREGYRDLKPSWLRAMVDDSIIEVSNAIAYNLIEDQNALQQFWINKVLYYWWWRFRAESYGIRRLWIRNQYGIDRIWINWQSN